MYPLVLIPRLERPEGSLKDTHPVLPFLMGILTEKKIFKCKFIKETLSLEETNMIGYPYSYGNELTPEMASNNRKRAYAYSVLIPSICFHNFGLGKQTQSTYQTQNIPKNAIVRVIKIIHSRSLVNSISRGGYRSRTTSKGRRRPKPEELPKPKKTGKRKYICPRFCPTIPIWVTSY